jgi:hypothetical protein
VSEENHHPERPAGEAGWPMPSAELQRLLQPVPAWTSSPRDDADADSPRD